MPSLPRASANRDNGTGARRMEVPDCRPGAALAAAAATAIVLMPREVRQPALVTHASGGVVTVPALAGADLRLGPAARFDTRPEPVERRARRGPPPHRLEPEIIVNAGDANAMRQVLDRINSGRMYLTPFVVAEQPIYIAPKTAQFTTAVDKMTGIVTKVDVTLTVVK